MKREKTLFVVLDIETTKNKRLAFDVAWTITDRQGSEYGSGSYLIKESLELDEPFFKQLWPQYLIDHEAGKIVYATISEVIDTLNDQIVNLKAKGHRVIICAYNARFDLTWLPYTYLYVTNDRTNKFDQWNDLYVTNDRTNKFDHWNDLLDIWDYWGESVPLTYDAPLSASGRYLSTSAENAYRYEFGQPEFVEKHIAWHDVAIEKDILLKALRRKKTMPVVRAKEQFAGNVWKKINQRVNFAIV